ncbi:DUF7139 domain-containing protein [Natronomonas sp.]|uniref:DUF7139 domain-containing protein n=1 Tax=Natronomonas sp. TaxID=2184060 RepID=UPI00260B3FA9|nr:hypothetical protein [Natronomonas sp.]
MASLTEVYEGGGGAGLRRLYAGVAMFGIGAVLVTAGLVVASTGIGSRFGLGLYRSRELAGALGGVGFPAVLLGTVVALPRAARRLRAAAAVGGAVCLFGVWMFVRWYPVDWVGGSGNTTMTAVVAATYFAGAILTSWSLFTAVANFKARNDPGGTISLEITKGGETRVVEVSNDELHGTLGGIGVLGATPDGEAETQTNHADGAGGVDAAPATEPSGSRGRGSTRSRTGGRPDPAGATDGGASGAGSIEEPSGTGDDAEFLESAPTPPSNDRYCGNCSQFRYARTDEGLVPYCGLHGEAMSDMDACEEWTSNTTGDRRTR